MFGYLLKTTFKLVNFSVKKYQKTKRKKEAFRALFLSTLVTIIFVVIQVFEIVSGDYQVESHTDSVTLTTTVAEVISLDCGSDVEFGTLTPGTPVTGTTTCTVTTNANGGYDLKVRRDDTDTTMDKTTDATVNITDKTDWDPTANSGNGNAATWSGTGLGFTLFASTATKNTTWWGTGTTVTDALNKYAGLPPTTYTDIMVHTSYSSGSTTNSIGYKLDVPTTQRSGAYDGSITFQATTTP